MPFLRETGGEVGWETSRGGRGEGSDLVRKTMLWCANGFRGPQPIRQVRRRPPAALFRTSQLLGSDGTFSLTDLRGGQFVGRRSVSLPSIRAAGSDRGSPPADWLHQHRIKGSRG